MDAAIKTKLKTQAHNLKPVIMIGQAGLTNAVLAETEIALDHHQLIKVKIRAERDQRHSITSEICAATGAVLIQAIGQIAVLYRLNPKKTSSAKGNQPPKSRIQHRRRAL